MNDEGISTLPLSPSQQRDDVTRYLALGGYIFLAISALAFSMTSYFLWLRIRGNRTVDLPSDPSPSQVTGILLAAFLPELISLFSGLITALVGYALLRSAGTARREIIPRQDATLLYQRQV
jgi:hypothetical protein